MPLYIHKKNDVVVAGGGTAGVIAALAAARTGARTLLVEEKGYVGGTAVTGLPLLSFHDNRGERIVGGLPWDLVETLKGMGEAAETVNLMEEGPLGHGGLEFNARNIAVRPEALKFVALKLLREAGVQLLLRTHVSDVVMAGNAVEGLVVENKSGRIILPADVVIDCTGDGDVAARAGASFEVGRPEDGITQPMTMLFALTEVDLDRAEAAGVAHRRNMAAMGSEEWQTRFRKFDIKLHHWKDLLAEEFPALHGLEEGFLVRDWGDQVLYAGNMLHIPKLNASDGYQLSQAEADGREFVWRLMRFMRQHVPGFERVHLIDTYDIGVRETRRIVGDYCLTIEDVLEARRFDDDVVLCGYWVDIHDYDGKWLHTPDQGTQVKGGGSYGIPFRCLMPQGIENLLLAGRCLSATHEAQASARVMGTSMAMGHATGTAAALASQAGVTPRALDIGRLQQTLESQGAIIR
jgi:hypothetical protein